MCTVTYIPVGDKRYLSSNRDESRWRSSAFQPQFYSMKTGRIVFPRDGDAGGTWFAIHENGNTLVLLNGAFKKHDPNPPYRKSRGLILLDLADQQDPFQAFLDIRLKDIEPFTVIIFFARNLYECRWDGLQKYYKELDPEQPYIWSSATLYLEQTVEKRQKWFKQWIERKHMPSHSDILLFHQFTGDGDARNDLMMNRDGITFTVSITSVELTESQANLQYLDLKAQKQSRMQFSFTSEFIDRR